MSLEWLTADFLKQCFGEEITSFSVSPAAPPGNNYGSLINRVSVHLEHHQENPRSIIIKSEVTSGEHSQELMASFKGVEYDFYYKFIPEVEKIIKAPFFPKAFPSPTPLTVLLEDLKEVGFSMAERLKQLDLEHCRLYVIAAATFHAVSFAVHKSNATLVEELGREKFFVENHKNEEFLKRLVANSLEAFREAVRNVDGYQHVWEILDVDPETFWMMIIESHKQKKTGINTLTQGDPWITNMMFRYDQNGDVAEVKLLDFQNLKYGSPVLDLTFFFWTSANNDVRNGGTEELFRLYVDTFNAKMEEFGCSEKFNFEGFMDDVNVASPHTLYFAMSCIPFTLSPYPVDIEEFSSQHKTTKNFFKQYYNEHFCSHHLPHILSQLDSSGTFEAFNRLKHETLCKRISGK